MLVVEPLIAPGLIVQFPDGKPLKTTLPVATEQVGCVMVPTVGAGGGVQDALGTAVTCIETEGSSGSLDKTVIIPVCVLLTKDQSTAIETTWFPEGVMVNGVAGGPEKVSHFLLSVIDVIFRFPLPTLYIVKELV